MFFFFHFSITQSVFLKTDYIKLLYDLNLKKKNVTMWQQCKCFHYCYPNLPNFRPSNAHFSKKTPCTG